MCLHDTHLQHLAETLEQQKTKENLTHDYSRRNPYR